MFLKLSLDLIEMWFYTVLDVLCYLISGTICIASYIPNHKAPISVLFRREWWAVPVLLVKLYVTESKAGLLNICLEYLNYCQSYKDYF